MSQELQVQAVSLETQAAALVVTDEASHRRAVEFIDMCDSFTKRAEGTLRPSVKKAYDAYKSMLAVLQSITDPAGRARKIAGDKDAVWLAEQRRIAEQERLRREEAARQAHLRELQEAEAERQRLQRLADQEREAQAKAAAAEQAAQIAYAQQQGASQAELEAIVAEPLDVPPPVQVYVPPPKFVPPPPPPKPVSVAGETTRTTWKAEVQDVQKLAAAVGAGSVAVAVLDVNMAMLNKLVSVTKDKTNIPGVRAYEDVTFVKGRK